MSVFVNDVVQLSIVGQCLGQRIMLTHYYKATVVATVPNNDIGIVTALLGWANQPLNEDFPVGAYLKCMPNNYALKTVRAQLIYTGRGRYVEQPGNDAAGQVASPAQAPNLGAALTVVTNEAGRRQRGTKHVGPVPGNAVLNGFITPAYTAELNFLGNALLASPPAALSGVTWIPVLYGKGVGGTGQLQLFRTGTTVRVQRRRTVGLGE